MIKLNDNATIFVKGFAQDVDYDVLVDPCDCHGEFVAIITDLVTSSFIKVTSATKVDGKRSLECCDGVIRTFEQEPSTPREMIHGKLVTNFKRSLFGDYYDVIFPDEYEEAIKEIAIGDKCYQIVGYISRQEVVTSKLVKLWIDATGKKHGLTMSGSHYIF